MYGMDIDQATTAMNQITTLTSELQDVITKLNQQVTGLGSNWTGPDATQFIGTVWPADQANLTKCKGDLDQLAATLKSEISQQTEASNS